MASGGLGNLTVDLLLETVQWIAGLNKAEYQAEQFADAIEKKFNKMVGNVGDALKGVAAGMVAGFAVDRLASFANEVQKTADRLDELAEKTGSSVKFMASMQIQADMGGVALEAMAQGFAKFNKASTEAFADEKSQPGKVFAALGVSVKDSAGQMRDAESVYKDAAAAMGNLEDSAIKTAAAQVLWGKSGADMIPVFNAMARQGLDAQKVIDNYGKTMAELAPIANNFNDALTIFQTTSKSLAAMLSKEFLPYFTTLIKQFTDLTQGADGLSGAMTIVVNVFKGIIIVVDLILTGLSLLVKGIIAVVVAIDDLRNFRISDAKKTIMEFAAGAGESMAKFGARVQALVDPLSTVTEEAKKGAKASQALANAVAKVPDFKFKIEPLKAVKAHLSDINEGIALMNRLTKELEDAINLDAKFYGVARAIEVETANLGKSRHEMELWRKEQELLEAGAAAGKTFEQIAAQVERLNKAFADKKAREDYLAFLSEIEGEWHKAFDAMFDDTQGGWEGMLKSLKASFKKILMNYLYEAFAKPFFMQIVAGGNAPSGMTQMSGTNGLINQFMGGGGSNYSAIGTAFDYVKDYFGAGTGGMDAIMAGENVGTAAGGLSMSSGAGLSMTSGAGYGALGAGVAGVAGGIIGGWGAGALGAGQKGVAAGSTYGSTLATVGMMVYGPIGAAIGAALGIIIGKATDPDPDAMRKATFGKTAGAEGLTEWAGKSAFGSFGFSKGEWLSSEQMGESMKGIIDTITNMDNAFAKFMTPEQVAHVQAKLDSVSKVYELGMEHLDVQGLAEVLKDRLSMITHEIGEGLGKFVDAFEGPLEDMVAVVDSYLELTSGANFDVAAIATAMETQKSMMESYQEGSAALSTYIDNLDTSAESMTGLVGGLQGFQEATLQMVLAIDAAAESMHAMFTATADGIRESLMTEEERYKFLQDRADALFADLMTETDPAKIQDLATRINSDINSAWSLLDDSQKSSLGQQYLDRLTTLDETVADKMSALREVVIEDSDTMMTSVVDKLAILFAKAETTAATNDDAAEMILRAAELMAQGVPVYNATESVDGG